MIRFIPALTSHKDTLSAIYAKSRHKWQDTGCHSDCRGALNAPATNDGDKGACTAPLLFKNIQDHFLRFGSENSGTGLKLAELLSGLARLQSPLFSMIGQSPEGFPLAITRAGLIEKNDPNQFLSYEDMGKRFDLKNLTSIYRLVAENVNSDSSAYLTAYVSSLEKVFNPHEKAVGRVDSWVHEDADSRKEQRRQGFYKEINDAAEQRIDEEDAPQGPKCQHALKLSDENLPKAISFALDDVYGLTDHKVDTDELYGKDKAPLDDREYQLIFDMPKVNLHEHYRGCASLAMVRAFHMKKGSPEALLPYNDFREFCRTKRLFDRNGKGPLYKPSLNTFRWKNDNIVSPAIHSDSTAYLGAYLYTLEVALDNVRYFEYRLSPLNGTIKDPLRYANAIQAGLDDARTFLKRHGREIDCNLIFSADRQPKDGVSLENIPKGEYDPRVQFAFKVLQATIDARKAGLRVTGFGIQGDEEGYAITDFKPVADALKQWNRLAWEKHRSGEWKEDLRIGATIHAGETRKSGLESHKKKPLTGAESIAEAIRLFYDEITVEEGSKKRRIVITPLRLGHATRIVDSPKLMRLCRRKHIGIEQCPKSNVQTGAVSYYDSLPTLSLSKDWKLPVSVNSDNRTTSKTDATNELVKLTRYLGAKHDDRKKMQLDGLETAFIFDPARKAAIQKDIIEAFKRIESDSEHSRTISLEKNPESFKELIYSKTIIKGTTRL